MRDKQINLAISGFCNDIIERMGMNFPLRMNELPERFFI